MSDEESKEVPNWLVKLEEQREKRLKAKLGHEAGAGAPCQNCGDKCPGLDLHFWRKICKICKCGKEDHDISDDDIYGFLQFQLLGSKPTKGKSIFLPGKKDAVTLDWTPKGSNIDVKKYLEGLPEELLPVKGSEAARVRKQRLQRQLPAHDIDASLCHALTPEEIQQLEEYVAHIRNHSVGQGKIIQIPILQGQQHRYGSSDSQLIHQHIPGQLSSSQPVNLHSASLAQNLQNMSLHDKNNTNTRATFLNSQLPNPAIVNTIDEQNPEYVAYDKERMHPNYAAKSLHQVCDNQHPVSVDKKKDLLYSTATGIPHSDHLISEKISAQHPVTGEKYFSQNPEYSKLAQQKLPYNKNSDFSNMHDTISHDNNKQNSEYQNKFLQNHPSADIGKESTEKIIDSHNKIPRPNINVVHSIQNKQGLQQKPQMLGKGIHNKNFPSENMGHIENVPYLNQNVDTLHQEQPMHFHLGLQNTENVPYYQNIDDLNNSSGVPPNFEQVQFLEKNEEFPEEILNPNVHNDPYNPKNVSYNTENIKGMYNTPMSSNRIPHNPEYAKNFDKNDTENVVHLPLTTSNVERHQEQFLNNDYPHLNDPTYKNRAPIPVFSAENKINPPEYEQNLSSVGYIRDIDYNIPKMQQSDLLNSNAVPTCHACKKLFKDGEFAVSVDRTDSLWHSECFNCHTCFQPLADLLYFFHKETDNIYCGRDYALLKGIPRCAACDELIFVREYCLAEDRTFHVKHFCCFECDEPLAGKQYIMENNQPNCVDCYEKLKAEKCTDCGFVIGPEEQGVSLQGLHWHATPQCFACKYCRKGLLGGKMLLRNQNLFCSDVCFKTYHA